jgi:phage terminase large subunit
MAQMKINFDANVISPHFKPLLLDDEHDVILMCGGGASGKSYFSFQRCVLRCLMDVRKYLIVRNSAVDLRKSCWEDVNSILSTWNLSRLVKVNKSTMTMEFVNGSKLVFTGLDDPEKVKSIPNITDIIVEECSEINQEKYSQLRQRMRGRGKLRNQLVMMTNPISKANWVYTFFFQDGCKEKNCLIHHSTYRDNAYLNEGTIDALEGYKTTNPYFYRVYCLGEWGSLSKQVYTNYKAQELDLDELRKKHLTQLVGLDFGYVNDPTAIVVSLLDEDSKVIYVINEFYQTGLLNDEIARVLKRMGLEKATIIADSAEQKSIDEIRKSGIRRIQPSVKGKDSVNQGIQRLQQYQLIVDPACANTLEELENYSWQKDKSTGEYVNKPIDMFNHSLDALRYSLQCVDSKAKLRTIPTNSL